MALARQLWDKPSPLRGPPLLPLAACFVFLSSMGGSFPRHVGSTLLPPLPKLKRTRACFTTVKPVLCTAFIPCLGLYFTRAPRLSVLCYPMVAYCFRHLLGL